jgi:hypothetical protein
MGEDSEIKFTFGSSKGSRKATINFRATLAIKPGVMPGFTAICLLWGKSQVFLNQEDCRMPLAVHEITYKWTTAPLIEAK